MIKLGKEFGYTDKKNNYSGVFFQKVKISNHSISFWKKTKCRSSGKTFTIHTGTQDGQSLGGRR